MRARACIYTSTIHCIASLSDSLLATWRMQFMWDNAVTVCCELLSILTKLPIDVTQVSADLQSYFKSRHPVPGYNLEKRTQIPPRWRLECRLNIDVVEIELLRCEVDSSGLWSDGEMGFIVSFVCASYSGSTLVSLLSYWTRGDLVYSEFTSSSN